MADINEDQPGGLFDSENVGFSIDNNNGGGGSVTKEDVYDFVKEILVAGNLISLVRDEEDETITVNNTRTDSSITALADQAITDTVVASYIAQFFESSDTVQVDYVDGDTQLTFSAEAPLQQPVQNNSFTSQPVQAIDGDGMVTVTVTPPSDTTIEAVDTVTVTGPDGTVVDNDMVTTVTNPDGTATVTVDTDDNPGDYNVEVTTTVMDDNGNEMLDNSATTVTATALIYDIVQAADPTALSQFGTGTAFNGSANITFTGGPGMAYIAVQTGKTYTIKTGIFFADAENIATLSGYDVYRINDYPDIDAGETLILEVVEA